MMNRYLFDHMIDWKNYSEYKPIHGVTYLVYLQDKNIMTESQYHSKHGWMFPFPIPYFDSVFLSDKVTHFSKRPEPPEQIL